MKKLVGVLLTLMLMLGAATPVLADCCDSLFGCAAAYVTDGLSCVLQAIVSTIKNLVALLTNLSTRASGTTQKASDSARQYVSGTIAKTRSDAQQASFDLVSALQQGNTIYKEETSLVTAHNSQTKTVNSAVSGANQPAPGPTRPGVPQAAKQTGAQLTAQSNVHSTLTATPAAPQSNSSNSAQQINSASTQGVVTVQQTVPPHGALAGLFEKAVAQIQKLKAAGDQDYPKVNQLMTQAEQTEGPALQSALAAADKAINDPIRNMISKLNSMLADPTNLFDPTDIVTQLENNVLANLDTNVNQMVDTITAGPQRDFDSAQPMQDELVANGQRAQQIAAAIQAAYSNRTQASLNALSQLLPLTAIGGNNAVGKSLVPSGALQPYSQVILKFKNDKQKIAPQAKQSMQAITPLLNQLKSLHTQAVTARSSVPTYKNSFLQKLNTMFTNKTQAEINTQRDQLISQVQAQYASEPKTRDKIVALLNSETAKIHAVPKH